MREALAGLTLRGRAFLASGVTGEVTVTVLWQQPGETTTRRLQMVNRIKGASSP